MSTTARQDREFLEQVIHPSLPTGLLEDVIDWIRKNIDPEDVFPEKQLERWAEANDYSKNE
jgi:hypothetical protein